MGSGVGSPRISPRFQLAEGEDVSDAAQRMIATIRNRLVTSPGRTPSGTLFLSYSTLFLSYSVSPLPLTLDLPDTAPFVRCQTRGGGLGSRPKKMYGERLGDGVEYHL